MNKAGYESLARFVKGELKKQGQDVDSLVAERINQYKRVQNLSPTKALEEIIAESCSMLLSDEENMRRFAEESPEVFTSMRDRFVGFVDSLRSIATKIAGRQPHGELNALLGKDSSLQRMNC